MTFKTPNQYRHRTGPMGTDDSAGNNGCFFIPNRAGTAGLRSPPLRVICSDGEGWEHVSVSLPTRCPAWVEMCAVKALFWDDEDRVMQLHPPRSEWVNNHLYCLHLWRPIGQDIPAPPSYMVGMAAGGE